MKPLTYIMTVQWGSGHHYIERTFDANSDVLAREIRNHRQDVLAKTRKGMRGAKPTVYVFRKID